MKFAQHDRGWADRGLLAGLTLLFVAGWVDFLARLHYAWPDLPHVERDWAISFAITYPLPWLLLLFKPSNKYLIALIAYLAFFAAMKLKFP
jgi:hypothetical protein